jgi:heterodisulfide reductase subunit A-like polyferredoxin
VTSKAVPSSRVVRTHMLRDEGGSVSVPVRIITHMKTRTVIVIGGGIGGLAAAVALANVGLDVTVAEQQSDLHASVYGVGIIQPVNALRALDVIGCAQACIDI